jgi:hypothetical protein
MTERKYPVRDSGPMYNFPMPTETLRAELAEAKGMIDAALELHWAASAGAFAALNCYECGTSWPCDTAKALGVTK